MSPKYKGPIGPMDATKSVTRSKDALGSWKKSPTIEEISDVGLWSVFDRLLGCTVVVKIEKQE